MEDLWYQTGGRFAGTGLGSALQYGVQTGDFSSAAYQLGYNSATGTAYTPNYANRCMDDSLTSLGLTVTDSSSSTFLVTAVSGNVSSSQLIEFLAAGQIQSSSNGSIVLGATGAAATSAINAYGSPLGFTINNGVASVTFGSYSTDYVNFSDLGTATIGGVGNFVAMSNGTAASNASATGSENTYSCQASSTAPDSTVEISGSAALSCSSSSQSAVMTVSGTNNSLLLDQGTADLTKSGDNVTMAENGSVVNMSPGLTSTLTCGSNTQVLDTNITGSSSTCTALGTLVTSVSNGTDDPTSGKGNVIDGNYDIDNWAASVVGSVNGSYNTINAGANSSLAVNGSSNTASLTGANADLTLAGSSESVHDLSSDVVNLMSGGQGTFSGGGTIVAFNNDSITANNTPIVFNTASQDASCTGTGNSVNEWANNDFFTGSNATLYVGPNTSGCGISGNNEIVNVAAGSTISAYGSNLQLWDTSTSLINLGQNDSASVSGGGEFTVANGDNVDAWNAPVVFNTANINAIVNGEDDKFSMWASNDTLTGGDSTLYVGSNLDSIVVNGSQFSIAETSGDKIAIDGTAAQLNTDGVWGVAGDLSTFNNTTADTSQLQAIDPTSNISLQFTDYASLNDTGRMESQTSDFTNNTSESTWWDPSNDPGVTTLTQIFAGLNDSGNMTSMSFMNTSNQTYNDTYVYSGNTLEDYYQEVTRTSNGQELSYDEYNSGGGLVDAIYGYVVAGYDPGGGGYSGYAASPVIGAPQPGQNIAEIGMFNPVQRTFGPAHGAIHR